MKESFLQRVKLWFKNVWHGIAKAFHQEQGGETFTFLGFVLLALVFWFLQGLNDEVEGKFEVPVEVQNIPEKAILIDEFPATIEVKLRDRGTAMLNYLFNGVDPIHIDFQEYEEGRTSIVLPPSQLRHVLQESLHPSTRILSMSLDTLRVAYTQNPGKRVKVVVKSTITTSPQTVVSGDIQLNLDSVLVYGDYKELDKIQEVYTEDIRETMLNDTLRKKVAVNRIPHVRIIPDSVVVMIPVEEMISKTLEVPVVAHNLPDNWRITILPSTVQLTCVMPFSRFSQVNDSSFVLGVEQPNLSRHSAKLGINVINAPAFVSNITLSQDSVDYILIEQH